MKPQSTALTLLLLSCAAWVAHGQQRGRRTQHSGFYVHHRDSVFYQLARKAGTDKVAQQLGAPVSAGHAYEAMYTKYFENNRRSTVSRLLEIGLGCNMAYGPGASSKLWRWYLPQATIYQAEYSRECADTHRDKLEALDIKVLVGDQANTTTLHEWIAQSGGSFDVIIDDGGHSNMQQFNSFMVLFQHALRPGGVYFMEDLLTGRGLVDGDKQHIIQDVIKDWIELLTLDYGEMFTQPEYAYKPRFPLPPGVKFIECAPGICAFTKCYRDDERCSFTQGVDQSLQHYTYNPPS